MFSGPWLNPPMALDYNTNDVRELDPTLQLTPQNDRLMSQRRILSFKPALRLERRGQDGQHKPEQRDHDALTLGDSPS